MANADAAKIEYINEHLFYEYEMLQYSLDKLKSCTDQLDWNAYFVSFVVFGRNLYRFLLNRRDNRTFRVGDFTDGYRPPKPGQIAGIIQKLDAQVLHLGKGRTKLPEGKAGIVAVTQLFNWIEANWPAFKTAMKPEYLKHWKASLAKVAAGKRLSFSSSIPGHQNTAVPTETSTTVVHVMTIPKP